MNDVQGRIMELVDELDNICKENNLHYILANKTALLAKRKGKFVDDTYNFNVMMPMTDMMKFQEIVEKKGIENREFETGANSKAILNFFVRYVNSSSLLIPYNGSKTFEKPGIALTIWPLRNKLADRGTNSIEMSLGLISGGKNSAKNISFLKSISLGYVWLMCKLGAKKHFTKKIYNKSTKLNNTYSQNKYYYNVGKRMVTFEGNLFENVDTVEFEGRKLPVASDFDKYMKKACGDSWKSLPKTNLSKSLLVFSDCDLPYAEFLRECKLQGYSIDKVEKEIKKYNIWKKKVLTPLETRNTETYANVTRTVDRIELWQKYQPLRQELADAFSSGDVETMEKLMKPYFNRTAKLLESKCGLYIDEELFKYATMVWEAKGNKGYAAKVMKYVPDLYLNESVEEYLKSRNLI